jgi:beta-lactamase regulating signal transducer with metallopeptidase domain
LLPYYAGATLRPNQLRAVLAHELAHVRRGDYAANLWQLVADGLLFFHPAARWISRRIRVEREYCCDDVAVDMAGDPAVYARALVALDDARSDCDLAVAAASGTLVDRISRITGRQRRTLTPARGVLAMAAATLMAAIIVAATLVLPQSVPAGAKLRRRAPPAIQPNLQDLGSRGPQILKTAATPRAR